MFQTEETAYPKAQGQEAALPEELKVLQDAWKMVYKELGQSSG